MSFLVSLQHQYTPAELTQLNAQLNAVLTAQPLDDLLLQKIIDKRANLVESLLINLDERQKRCFAVNEIKTNDVLVTLVERYRDNAKAELVNISKSSKAIKKYHQV